MKCDNYFCTLWLSGECCSLALAEFNNPDEFGKICAAKKLFDEYNKLCKWRREYDEGDCWISECDTGGIFELNEGTPYQNGMRYCFRCGKPMFKKIKR